MCMICDLFYPDFVHSPIHISILLLPAVSPSWHERNSKIDWELRLFFVEIIATSASKWNKISKSRKKSMDMMIWMLIDDDDDKLSSMNCNTRNVCYQ